MAELISSNCCSMTTNSLVMTYIIPKYVDSAKRRKPRCLRRNIVFMSFPLQRLNDSMEAGSAQATARLSESNSRWQEGLGEQHSIHQLF